jgi:hypothetical protein
MCASVLGRPSSRYVVGLLATLVAAVAVSLATGARHDYVHFLEQWNHTMRGGDPWDQSLHGQNPGYGPLFNALAPLAQLFPLLPKIIFVAAWVATAAAVTRLVASDSQSSHMAPAALAYFALTPYFWIEIPLYGHFDILPAAATLASVHLTLKHRTRLGAGLLAIGALLKIVPGAALPFLISARPDRWKAIVLSFAGTCAVIFIISYGLWGPSTLTAILLPAHQGSDLFSVFRFARGSYSPLRLVTDSPNLDVASVPMLVAAGVLMALILGVSRAHLVVSVLATFVLIFALYKLGHPQFQMVVFVMLPYLLLTLPDPARRDRLLWGAACVYLAWFSVLDLLYVVGKQLREPPWLILREFLGLPTFALAILLTIVLLRFRHQPVVLTSLP